MTMANEREVGLQDDFRSGHETAAELAARLKELSEINATLIGTVEAERSTLAKTLHDELGGLITAAKMDMSWLTKHLAGKLDGPAEEKIRSLTQMLSQAMMLNRRVVEALKPSLLDHFGLSVALGTHFDEECAIAGLECISTLPEEITDLDGATQLTLFRVGQEALHYIIWRGGAKHIELVLDTEADGYVLTVGDDGQPLDAAGKQKLIGMRYRVLGAGGTFSSESMPGQGNRIRAFVPRSKAISG
jgi:signal transduction histidine kinase